MTPEREARIRDTAAAFIALMGRGSDADPATSIVDLLAEIDRLRARLAAAGAVVSEIGCDCTCHVPEVDDGEHDDGCDGPCVVCRMADALWPERRRGGR